MAKTPWFDCVQQKSPPHFKRSAHYHWPTRDGWYFPPPSQSLAKDQLSSARHQSQKLSDQRTVLTLWLRTSLHNALTEKKIPLQIFQRGGNVTVSTSQWDDDCGSFGMETMKHETDIALRSSSQRGVVGLKCLSKRRVPFFYTSVGGGSPRQITWQKSESSAVVVDSSKSLKGSSQSPRDTPDTQIF